MIFSKKDIAFLSLIAGISFLISGVFLLIWGFSDYLLLSLVFIIGMLSTLSGAMIYKDSLEK